MQTFGKRNPKTTTFGIALVLMSMLMAGATQAREFDIKTNHVKYDGVRYFVKESSAMKLGSYGEKKSPPTQQNYLAKHSDFKRIGRTEKSPPAVASVRSNTNLFHNGVFSMPIKLVNLGINDTGFSNMVRDKKCSFVRERIADRGALMRALNADRNVINYLKQKNSSRIVDGVIRIHSCIVRSSNTHAGRLKGDVAITKAKIKVKGTDATTNQNEVFFAHGPNTVIGYTMLKFRWDKKSKKKRSRIVGFEDDRQSIN